MAYRKQGSKSPSKRLEYQVTITAPRMRATTVELRASNSSEARREARKQFREENPKRAEVAHYSARRKER